VCWNQGDQMHAPLKLHVQG